MVKVVDAASLSSRALREILASRGRPSRASASLRLAAMRELELRASGLDFDRTFELMARIAASRRFVSGKEIADASGVDWARARGHLERHLARLAEYAEGRGWPTPAAVAVTDALDAIEAAEIQFPPGPGARAPGDESR